MPPRVDTTDRPVLGAIHRVQAAACTVHLPPHLRITGLPTPARDRQDHSRTAGDLAPLEWTQPIGDGSIPWTSMDQVISLQESCNKHSSMAISPSLRARRSSCCSGCSTSTVLAQSAYTSRCHARQTSPDKAQLDMHADLSRSSST